MNLTGIIAITGMPGLYKVLGQTGGGVIVESLLDKKRFPVFGANKISALEDISMFTTGDDKPLSEIIQTIFDKEKGGPCVDHKADDKTIIAYFAEILPDYDKERVYVSNMRKLFSWYNILQSTDNLKQEAEATEGDKKLKSSTDEAAKKKIAKTQVKDTTKGAGSTKGVKKAAGVRKTGSA